VTNNCELCNFARKLVAMIISPEISVKEVQIDHFHPKHLHTVKKIAKIGQVGYEIIVFRLIIKKERKINASEAYSPSSKFAERAKIR